MLPFVRNTEAESNLSPICRTKISPIVGALPTVRALDEVLCTQETREALRCHPGQKQTLHPAELEVEDEVEAEFEELCDFKEVRRNSRLLAQLNGEKSLEEFQSV